MLFSRNQAPVVQRLDSAIRQINCISSGYPVDKCLWIVIYPVHSAIYLSNNPVQTVLQSQVTRVLSHFRTCGEKPDCKHICTEESLHQQAPSEIRNLTWDCIESLHVYKRQPALADNYDEDTDPHKLGLAVFRHYSCTVSGCGPNYCCCRAVAL